MKNNNKIKRAFYIFMYSILIKNVAIAAEPVTVSLAEGERGRGLALLRGEECFILTPAHVVMLARNPRIKIKVTGADGAQGNAVLAANVGTEADDIALLRIINNADRICSDQINLEIKQKQGANLVLRENHGGLTFIPVDIHSLDQRTLGISSKSEFIDIKSMMSGSLLIENGKAKGLLISVPTEKEKPAEVRSLGYLAGLLGAWVSTGINDIPKINNALSIIEKAIKMKPSGDIGQIAAIEQLVREGASFSGMELQGISFNGATIDHVNFAKTRLVSSDFKGASLINSTLDEAHLHFSNLEKIQLAGSSLKGTRFYFVDALGANFQNINATQSNWSGASLRGASFKGAKLNNASFAYADLTGADFTGADLTGAFFIGTIVQDAKFEGATILNTDFTASMGETNIFSDIQKKELCSSQTGRGLKFNLINVIHSSQFSDGKKYDFEYEGYGGFPDSLRFLERCKQRTIFPMGLYPIYEGHDTVVGEISLRYAESFLDKNGQLNKFKTRMRDHFKMLQDAWKTNSFIEVHGNSYNTLLKTLKSNVKNTKLEEPVFLTSDAYMTLLLRFNPQLFNKDAWDYHLPNVYSLNDWSSVAKSWVETQEERLQPYEKHRLEPRYNAWPRFFPKGTNSQALATEHILLFKEWSENRANTMPMIFKLSIRLHSFYKQLKQVYSPQKLSQRKALGISNNTTPVTHFSTTPVAHLLNNRNQSDILTKLQSKSVSGSLKTTEWLKDSSRLVHDHHYKSVFIFDKPLNEYKLNIPAHIADQLRKSLINLELLIKVEDVDISEMDEKIIYYIKAKVLDFQLRNHRSGFRYPEKF